MKTSRLNITPYKQTVWEQIRSTDRFHDQCGVFAVFNHPEAANITYLGLHALQHRGQEAAGIVTSDGERLQMVKKLGLVQDVFKERHFEKLKGRHAIGHVRYSTTGSNSLPNAQPIRIDSQHGEFAVGHNGNLVQASEARQELEREGAIFQSTSDTEILVHRYARSQKATLAERVKESLESVRGAYSITALTVDTVVGARDPFAVRPLCLGRLGDATILTSETCALELIEAEFVREISPGELIIINEAGEQSHQISAPTTTTLPKHCVFEYIYFAKPTSRILDKDVYKVRRLMGEMLAVKHPADADVVIPVPDSGLPAALGFSKVSGLPFEMGLVRSHYVGRTFIEPKQSIRDFGVKLKQSVVREVIEGKRVVVVDDSIVRGTTTRKINALLRRAGAKEIHVRISAPPTTDPCHYGIDTPTREELIANRMSLEEIRKYVLADSLAYLDLHDLYRGCDLPPTHFCDACFSGEYPI